MSNRRFKVGSKVDLVVSHLLRKDQVQKVVVLKKELIKEDRAITTFAGSFNLQRDVKWEMIVGFNMSRNRITRIRRRITRKRRKKIQKRRKYVKTVNLVKAVGIRIPPVN